MVLIIHARNVACVCVYFKQINLCFKQVSRIFFICMLINAANINNDDDVEKNPNVKVQIAKLFFEWELASFSLLFHYFKSFSHHIEYENRCCDWDKK